ncbi:hypothetical protein BSKO_05584 [Bryopsis sp. KO-2023]|nr:hypothetical protein BSKO_05584 [Bryopsis sp. KO-2023]
MLRKWARIKDILIRQCSAPTALGSRGLSSLPSEKKSDATSFPAMPPFDYLPPPYTGPSAKDTLEMRRAHFSSGIFHFYKEPIMIVEGKMQYLFDERGRRFVDAIGGIVTVSVGHCHPRVVQAIETQARTLQHASTIYLHPETSLYAKELSEKLPDGLDVVFFCNSGSEASELAALLARLHSGNMDLVSLSNSYHGWTNVPMTLGGIPGWKQAVLDAHGVHHAEHPSCYRGEFGAELEKYIHGIEGVIKMCQGGKVAGFMSEPIQGAGGCVTMLPGFLKEAYKAVREAGGVCVADEVQCGFGRTGEHFWGFEMDGVVPDIVTMAKGIGNGLPLAAVATTREIAERLANKLYFNTFGGNPVVSAGGRAVLKVIEEEGLQENSRRVGKMLKSGLETLKDKHDIIGDVRGCGLMLGVELVKDRTTKEPAKEEVAEVFESMKDMGLLVGKGGGEGNVFRIKPPMCFSEDDARFVVEVMDKALSDL